MSRFLANVLRTLLPAVCLSVSAAGTGAWAHDCALASQHAGIAFPVERLEASWRCRLQPIVDDFTTANKIGPIRTPLPEAVYVYLLDRPPTAAALLNRLDLGLYKAEERGARRYWGDDGEGTTGLVELIYQDATHRVYYLDGAYEGAVLPRVTGKAVVLLRMVPAKEAGTGRESVDTTLVAYTKLDSRFAAGVLSLLRPLVGSLVAHKLTKGVAAVTQLGWEMQRHPERVLFEAADPPPLPAADVAFLTEAVAAMRSPKLVQGKERAAP